MLRRVGLAAASLCLAMAATACTSETVPPTPPKPSPPAGKPIELTMGVFGSKTEQNAFQSVIDSFNASAQGRQAKLVTWPDHEAAREAVLAGDVPDVFMASRRDLAQILEAGVSRPVSRLLDERGVDFGDRYSRDALESFSKDSELQCMGYSISPMVIYYNDELIDFEKMAGRGLDVPSGNGRWTLDQFAAAATFASRKSGVKGVWIDPTLRGLAPFIYSGGGKIFDDTTNPTSLALHDEGTREALDRTLTILRDPTLTPTPKQLRRADPVQLFQRGKLAMVAGFRDLVPKLRSKGRPSFDVISMPVLDSPATVGDITGLCISADTEHVNDAADLLAYSVSDSAVERVTRTGYIVPANTQVAGSQVFLGEGRDPSQATVFNSAIRGMVVPPLLDNTTELSDAVAPLVADLVTAPGVLDLDAATLKIDEASRAVLDPDYTPSPTPTESD